MRIRFFTFLFLFTSTAVAQTRFVETGAPQTKYVGLQAPAAVTSNYTLSLPSADGAANQCLATNGAGLLQWRSSGNGYSLDASDGSPTNAVYVDATGNVGVGTTSPGLAFDLQGTDSSIGMSVANRNSTTNRYPALLVQNYDGTGFGGSPTVSLVGSRGTMTSPTLTQSGDSLGIVQAFGQTTTVYSGNAQAAWIFFSADANFSSGSAPGNITLSTTGVGSTTPTGRVRISSAGNLGVGTLNPAHRLNVQGATGATANVFVQNSDFVNGSAGSGLYLGTGANTGTTFSQIQTFSLGNAASAPLVLNQYGGNVGIGTSGPTAGLDVATTGAASALVVPRDTTANRPSTPVSGMVRYNSTTNRFEGYEAAAWVNLSSGLMGKVVYTGIANCAWGNTNNVMANNAADTDCNAATASAGATAPGTKIPGIVINNLPPGDYEVTVSAQFVNFSSSNCRWTMSDGTTKSGAVVGNLGSESQSQFTGLFSYTTTATRTFQVQSMNAANATPNQCLIANDEPANFNFEIWVKRI